MTLNERPTAQYSADGVIDPMAQRPEARPSLDPDERWQNAPGIDVFRYNEEGSIIIDPSSALYGVAHRLVTLGAARLAEEKKTWGDGPEGELGHEVIALPGTYGNVERISIPDCSYLFSALGRFVVGRDPYDDVGLANSLMNDAGRLCRGEKMQPNKALVPISSVVPPILENIV